MNTQTPVRATSHSHLDATTTTVDVVTVAYNSADELRACVEQLAQSERVAVFVVDNASSDGGLATVADLDLVAIPLETNRGFAQGCNVGWQRGRAPYVLFLNPDARIAEDAVERLVGILEAEPGVGAAAPIIMHPDGTNAYSLRRFPTLTTTFASALFLHRIAPTRAWTDELIRDPARYEKRWTPEWVSGACILVRRSLLEQLGGWDERFFLFGEDMDLCHRIRDAGHTIVFDPEAVCVHVGGASAPKDEMLPILVESRLKYLAKHHGRLAWNAYRAGLCLSAATHAVLGHGARKGHLRALLVAATCRRERS